jgi:DNA processing protein
VHEVGEQNPVRNIQNTAAEDAFWLGLQDKTWLIPTAKMVESYERSGTMLPLWNASYEYLIKLGIDDECSRKYLRYKEKNSLLDYIGQIKKIEALKFKIIRYTDRNYPSALRNIENPPLVLLHKGELDNMSNCIAIAGTRNPSAFGRIMARKIAKYLAEHGYTIVSGLARGIDEWAHIGALESRKGKSIAVLAWVDPIYPEEHKDLALDLQKRGAIIGENFQQPFNKSTPAKFVQRNRITSGISQAVVAVESDSEGGTVHQVKIALSQKRKVFAVQPQGNERAKRGFKLFMDLGAIPIKSPMEIAEILKRDIAANSSRIDLYYQHSLDR